MNKNKTRGDEVGIDLLELLRVLIQKWWLILIGALVGAIGMMLVTSSFITPMYQSQAMLYVLDTATSDTSLGDIEVDSAVTEDFAVIATSKPVIDGTIKKLQTDYNETFTRKEIFSMLEVSNIEDTRVFCIKVTSENPEDACAIANVIAETAASQMEQITKSDPPTIVEDAEVEKAPISPSMSKNALIGFAGAAVLICAILIIRFLIDDSIKNEEQIKKYLGAPTLATIPFISEKERKRAEYKLQKVGKHV